MRSSRTASRRCVALLLALLASLFVNAMALAAGPDRPVVFIPGILGSKLCSGDRVLWGNALSLANFAELQIQPGAAPKPITACGLVDNINLLGPFWTVHQYDEIISTLKDLGYVDGSTLFVFTYDWRQSNVDTAKALAAFIERTPQLRNQPFDIVAHSMGGIVTRLYLQRVGEATKIRKLIYLGTPFAGSMNALATLSDGWGAVANQLAGGIDTIRRVVLSFPGMYELFPSYDQCCRLGSEAQFSPLNLYDFDTWKRLNWLPSDYQSGAGEQTVRTNLARARDVRDVMRQSPPSIPQVLVAGDAFATRLYLYAATDDPSWKKWRFSKNRGDGTVPVWSAANNIQSLAGTIPAFSEHATIFADQGVKDVLLRELVSNAAPKVATVEALFRMTTKSGAKSARLIDVAVQPNAVATGGTTELSVSIDFDEPVGRNDYQPTAELLLPNGPVALELRDVSSDSDIAVRRLSFAAKITAPQREGAWQINVAFPGQGQHATYFQTWRQP